MPSTLDGGPEVTPGAQTHLREAVPLMQRLVYPSRCHGADKLARHQRELWSGAKDQGGEGRSACTLYCRHTAHCSERSAGSLRDSIQPVPLRARHVPRKLSESQAYGNFTSYHNRCVQVCLFKMGFQCHFVECTNCTRHHSLSWRIGMQHPDDLRCFLLCVLKVIRSGTGVMAKMPCIIPRRSPFTNVEVFNSLWPWVEPYSRNTQRTAQPPLTNTS